MDPMYITLIVLGVAIVCFVTNIIPLTASALCVPLALYFTNVLTAQEMLAGLTDSTTLMFVGMFIIGGSFLETGVAKLIGNKISSIVKTETQLMVAFMVLAMVLSSFLSNVGTCIVLLPILIGACESKGYNSSKLLMPLALACSVGGMNALPGAAPNGIIKAGLEAIGTGETFGFFEYALAGIPMCVITIVYVLTIGKKLMPKTDGLVKKCRQTDETGYNKRNQIICAATFGIVILCMAFESQIGIPLYISAGIGVVVLLVTRVVKADEAFESVEWVTISLIAGMLPMSTAMSKSGAAQLIADFAIKIIGENASEVFFTAVIFVIGAFITQFMSNTAATALLTPIVISIADAIGLSPKFALIALCIGASSAFATPMGTPCNTVVMGYAGYKFNDYVRIGIPLLLIEFVFFCFYIPLVWH